MGVSFVREAHWRRGSQRQSSTPMGGVQAGPKGTPGILCAGLLPARIFLAISRGLSWTGNPAAAMVPAVFFKVPGYHRCRLSTVAMDVARNPCAKG